MDGTKKCSECKTEKVLNLFSKDIRYSKGVKSMCKECITEKYREKKRIYLEANKEKIYAKHKEYRKAAKDKILKKHKEWLANNKERVREADRLHRNKNRDRELKNRAAWIENNKSHFVSIVNKYRCDRKKVDPNFKLACNLRSRIWDVLKRNKKSKTTVELLGISIDEFRVYIEDRFKDGMGWHNYNRHGWHIDHIRPCASFDLTDPEQQKQCFHYTNLQPLWAKENLMKKDKYEK